MNHIRSFFGALLVAATAHAALPTPEQVTALRLAINDLTATFPTNYTRGADFLQRLDAVSDEAGFIALQREALLAYPLLDFDKIILLKREFPKPAEARQPPGAWHGGLGIGDLNAHTSDTIPRQGHWRDALAVLSDLRGAGRLESVYTAPNAETLIDPVLHTDADRVLFAKLGEREQNWRLWERNLGSGQARQVSPDDGADVGHFDPCYLPDGRIICASTASYQGLPCEFGGRQMVCLYQLDPRKQTMRQLTFEQDSDWCPTMLPNGRVLYQRWEYTDQSHANSRMLFHMNPDGTDQRVLRGRGSWFPGSFFYARPIPGRPAQFIGIAGGHHDVPRSGRLLLFDVEEGRHDSAGTRELPGRGRAVEPIVRDGLTHGLCPQFLMPQPLSANYHLVICKPRPDALWGLYLIDVFDNVTLIKEVEGAALLWPAPLRKTPAPPILPDRVKLASNTATVHIQDIYAGPGLAGVPRGTVKQLRVIEYYFSRRGMGGLYGTLGFDGPWDIKRILGTVPVEADGSAHFSIPANTPLSLQPLDDKGQALQLMRSWLVGMPGERVSCVGCHESENAASLRRTATATGRAPSPIAPWHGPARGFSFVREVQPVLDKYCVGCHGSTALTTGDSTSLTTGGGAHAGRPNFTGGVPLTDWTSQMPGHWKGGGKFTQSYFELQRYLRRNGIEGDRRMLTPLEFHFGTTELGQMLRLGHHGVQLDAEAWERLALCQDFNAQFYGTWGEIPPLNKNGHVTEVNARADELRRKYVPMGPFPDYEAIPETPKFDTTPVKAAENLKPETRNLKSTEWTFTSAEAVRRQKDTAPAGGVTLTIPLAEDQPQPPPVSARYVRVAAGPARWLSIAEAEVLSDGKNIARGKPASQSSTYGTAHAGLAVDGQTEGVFSRGSVSHTGNGASEWWEVDLGAVVPVERLVFWNRTDCAQERLAGCTVTLLDAQRNIVWREQTPATVGRKIVLLDQRTAPALKFAWIPPGAFVMGGAAQPQARAQIDKGFWMGRCEITNEQLRQCDPAHDSRTEDRHGYQFGITGYDEDQPDQPAVRVSWHEAQAFCAWLARKTGKRVTLPTETQWEWACRAGTATPFWFGDLNTDFAPFANLGDAMLAKFCGNPYQQDWQTAAFKNPNKYDNWIPQEARFNDGGFVTEPVGKYQPNPWGLCDMHGNAAEWTSSDAGADKVVRGGSWYDRPFRCTSDFRLPYPPWQRVFNVGFRVIIEDAP